MLKKKISNSNWRKSKQKRFLKREAVTQASIVELHLKKQKRKFSNFMKKVGRWFQTKIRQLL
jgi:hypothetical protein